MKRFGDSSITSPGRLVFPRITNVGLRKNRLTRTILRRQNKNTRLQFLNYSIRGRNQNFVITSFVVRHQVSLFRLLRNHTTDWGRVLVECASWITDTPHQHITAKECIYCHYSRFAFQFEFHQLGLQGQS